MLPKIYQVKAVEHETHDVFTLILSRQEDIETSHSFLPGQFNMLSPFGFGEAAISISGHPANAIDLIHTIRAVGSVTEKLKTVNRGDLIGVRGPYGRPWPLFIKGCDVLIIAGGVGLAPLRSALYQLIANQSDYRKISLLYGARAPEEIVYSKEFRQWENQGIDIKITVDYAGAQWEGRVGVVTSLIKNQIENPNNTLVLICGPEIMLKIAVVELMRAKVREDRIFLALERNMQCAEGFCGHCQYGPYFLCKDGPIFSYSELKYWLNIKEL
jgi:NAD(P)H-flavin reductase